MSPADKKKNLADCRSLQTTTKSSVVSVGVISYDFPPELDLRSIKCLIIVCLILVTVTVCQYGQGSPNRYKPSKKIFSSPLCFPLHHQPPLMIRQEDMHRSGYSSTKTATIPAATFQTPVRFGTPDTPPSHTTSPYPLINQQSNPPSPGPGRAYPNRSNTLNYPAPQPIDPGFPHVEDGMTLIGSPGRLTSIEPGVYEIKNDVLGATADFNEVDRKSVVGYQYHGKGNQQVSSSPGGWSKSGSAEQ